MAKVRVMCTSKQRQFLETVLYDNRKTKIGYGGARGGGKTMVSTFAMALRRFMYPGTPGIMFRKTEKAAEENIKSEIDHTLKLLGIPKNAYKYYVDDKKYVFKNGSTVRLAFIRQPNDYESYVGSQFTDMVFEEANQHEKRHVLQVTGSNRTHFPGCVPKQWYTFNPGGIGSEWCYNDFVNKPDRKTLFIPSYVDENLALLENDPGYINRVLNDLPDWLRRQWRDGDWHAIAGAYFWLNPAQVTTIIPPSWADWYGGTDWGRAKPFCTLWAARWKDREGNEHLHIMREIYKAGLELDEQALEVKRIEAELGKKYELYKPSVLYYADPSIVRRVEGVSTEATRTTRSTWMQYGFYPLPSRSNARIPGWNVVRMLMKHGILTIDPSCGNLLNEIRRAVYEGAANGGTPTGEDLQQGSGHEDHALDALRYLVLSVFGMGFKTTQRNAYDIISKQTTAFAA